MIEPRYAPGMNVSDHKPHCDILTTRDGWDADCTCALPAPAEEKRSYAPTDAIGDARVEAVEEGP